jgi:hypothetical protein
MDAIYAEALNFADGHRFDDDVCFLGLKLVRLAGEVPVAAVPARSLKA